MLQTEAAECGLVYLAMVASYRSYRIDLQYLWKIFFISFKGMNQTHYVVTITPELDHVMAYGKKEPLQTGMHVDADIWLDRRTLLEWIMEPLYSVSGRV